MASESPPSPPPGPPRRGRSSLVALALLTAGGLAAALGGLVAFLASVVAPDAPGLDFVRLGGLVTLLVGLALAVAGLGLLVFRPVLEGRPQAGFGTHRVMLGTTAFAVLLAVLVGNLLPLVALAVTGQRSLNNVPGFLSAAAGVSLVLLGVAYFRFIRPGVVTLADLGFSTRLLKPSVGLVQLGMGFVGGLVVLITTMLIGGLLREFGVEQTQLQGYNWIRALAPWQFALIFLAGAVLAPLAEEVFFRGIVFRSYLLTRGPLVAYLLSSLVFSSLHLNLQALLPILVLGIVLAYLYHLTWSLVPCVVAHGINNGVVFLVLYLVPESLLTRGG